MVRQELKEREVVETQINSVKSWVQETKEYLGNPTIEIDAQLEELKVQNSFPRPIMLKNCPAFNQMYLFIFNEIIELKIFRNVFYNRLLVLFHWAFFCSV